MHRNRLSREKSPYLLQHQSNPVDWYAWSEEAFTAARREQKPILLSIGYSTCHWCHVMERESFENTSTADILNAHFISIKVDREERPDVDKIYMTFVQSTTGQGGWPLNVFLTPDLKPFYGGTYFPPEPRHGRPSFNQLLEHVHEIWTSRRTELEDSAAELHAKLETFTHRSPTSPDTLSPDIIENGIRLLQQDYDPVHGGFGGAPKFPRPCQPIFLLRATTGAQPSSTLSKITHTCEAMAQGGLMDQLAGGFHRYSVDDHWLVPHFEKMLYDNAQLAQLYLDVFVATNDPNHAHIVRTTLDYVANDMTLPEGGFCSAEDADSEGQEGKFYCWTLTELQQLLAPDELKLVTRRFGITAQGNFIDHSHPNPLPELNVLSLVDQTLSPQENDSVLQSALEKMRRARSQRTRPLRDDKVLSSWNGLMLGAFARAGIILDQPQYIQIARKNLAFLQEHLWDDSTKTLYHRWREGQRDNVQLLYAYAALLSGTIDLYQATLDPQCLRFAVDLADALIHRFADKTNGGFFQSPPDDHLILHIKDEYDGAEPSGNSLATLSLLLLGAITQNRDYTLAAEASLNCFSSLLRQRPHGMPTLLQALHLSLQDIHRVVLVNPAPNSTPNHEMLRAFHLANQYSKVVLSQHGPVDPFTQTLKPMNNKPTAYVCIGTTCRPPACSPDELQQLLNSPA